MNQLNIYAIRDSKGEVYGAPYFQPTDPEAVRQFHRLVKDPASMPSSFPDDFDLYRIGKYDTKTGKIDALKSPEHMVKAVTLINK